MRRPEDPPVREGIRRCARVIRRGGRGSPRSRPSLLSRPAPALRLPATRSPWRPPGPAEGRSPWPTRCPGRAAGEGIETPCGHAFVEAGGGHRGGGLDGRHYAAWSWGSRCSRRATTGCRPGRPNPAMSPPALTKAAGAPERARQSSARSAAQPLTSPVGSNPSGMAHGSNQPADAWRASRQRSSTSTTSPGASARSSSPRRSRLMGLCGFHRLNTASAPGAARPGLRLTPGMFGCARVRRDVERDDRSHHRLLPSDRCEAGRMGLRGGFGHGVPS